MRPSVKITPNGIDRVLDITCVILLAVLWLVTIYAFTNMPDTIPTHYNGTGKVDGYGSKLTIFMLPAVATVLVVLLTWINKYPHIFNYPTQITEANARRQYTLATRMFRFLRLAIVIIFTEITVSTYLITQGIIKGLGVWFIPLELSIIAVPIVILFIRAGKEKRNS